MAPSPSKPAPTSDRSCRYFRPPRTPTTRPVGSKSPAGDKLPGKATTAKQSFKGSRFPVPLFALRAVKMRLYLSSERLGERAGTLLAMVHGPRVAVIANGYDGASAMAREIYRTEVY